MSFPRMHVSLYVSNLAASVNFYSTFFGQPATKVKPGYAKYVLDSPSLIISFIENPERVQSNFGHLGFQVETAEEMNARLEVARKQGLPKLGVGLDYVFVGTGMNNFPDSGKDVIMPMVTVSLPIFRKKYDAAVTEAKLMQENYSFQKEAYENNKDFIH